MTEHGAAWPPEDIELLLDDDSEIDSDSEEIYDSKGNRITDDYVNDAIADVHRTIDEGRVPVPTGRGGRPSLSGESMQSPRVSFRVPEELRERAKARAAQEGKTVSALAREAFEQFLRAGCIYASVDAITGLPPIAMSDALSPRLDTKRKRNDGDSLAGLSSSRPHVSQWHNP